ncbi:MAG: sulfotransferase family protein [Bacteroidetes bacterium]|nr:MAG: sulfotransferase family protein [Bacteroidota bacterium]PTM08591.1 MAG: sulfotransferase family protein [Bacteroidota bacterium]
MNQQTAAHSYLKHWIPYDLLPNSGNLLCRWIYLGNQLFTEPFFTDTVAKCLSLPQNSTPFTTVTDLDALANFAPQVPSLAPTAFIFHISRCGSTLLTQLLSENRQHIVISEAPIFDQILRLHNPEDEPQRLSRLQDAIRLVGQKRFKDQARYFIKWDSWHLFFLEEIRSLYPTVPMVFLRRDLSAVMASHRQLPGMQAVPGLLEPALFGFTTTEFNALTYADYLPEVLRRMRVRMETFCATDHYCLSLDYEAGVLHNFERVLTFLQMDYTAGDLSLAANRAKFYSKDIQVSFKP